MRPRLAHLALVALFAMSPGCTKQQLLASTGTTLETIQTTTDVAWTYAVEQDLREQQAVIDELRAVRDAGGTLPPQAEAVARLAAIRARWEPRFEAFRAIRAAHALAVAAWEAYRDDKKPLEALLGALDDVLELYRAMQDLLGDVPALDLHPEVNP